MIVISVYIMGELMDMW